MSTIRVTGPSFSDETCIYAPNSPCCTSKPRSRPAAVAHVAVERELAHDQHASAHIRERQVHFIIFIAEYAQTEDFFGQLAAERGRIVRPDAEQDEIDGAKRLGHARVGRRLTHLLDAFGAE